MHLLASYKNGSMRALPQVLPPGLYEAASRRGVPRQMTGSRPISDGAPATTIPRQFSGPGYAGQPQSPARPPYQQAAPTGDAWAVTPQDKAQFDHIYATVDTQNRGSITGEQAVQFFSNSRLPEDALAQIWDLADINSEGQLTKDEFAVAMYLIRQQRSKRDGRDVLPQSLPPNLIPPSMRRQPIAPQQPTAPTFDNAANISQPKSASEDLFGLDAFSSSSPPAPVAAVPKAAGDSSNMPKSFREQASPTPQQYQSQQPSHFKPFIPSSTFGQTMMTPQGTGSSSTASPSLQSRGLPQQQKQSTAMDDLLGNNDPEVSKRLTNETSELANLSNQVTSLSGQMQEVKTKRGSIEHDLSQAQAQKRDFEGRLSQLRSSYEQEIREVQALEERLKVSKIETSKLQQEIALIDGTNQDLQVQHRQIHEALNADQAENADLKQRISHSNNQVAEIKPRLEKLKSDARQHKGLVAINKKQLATNEAELEKIKADLDQSAREHEEAKRELEQSQRDLEAASHAVSQARSLPPTSSPVSTIASPPAQIVSPTPGTASMNPFFRRTSNATGAERSIASPLTAQNVTSPNHNAFDSFFGPPQDEPAGPPPATSIGRSETPNSSRGLPRHMTGSTEGPGIQTPSDSPPTSNISDSPQIRSEPPAPPQSRQITSSFLPLRPQTQRADSETSSLQANPPASRAGFETPTERPGSSTETPMQESPKQHFENAARASQAAPHQLTPPSSLQTPASTEGLRSQEAAVPHPISTSNGLPSAAADVPGAFPGDDTPPGESPSVYQDANAGPYNHSKIDPHIDPTSRELGGISSAHGHDPFAMAGTGRHSPMAAKDDFESAFAGFGSENGKAADQTNGAAANGVSAESSKTHGEFPPIQEFGTGDESDSDDDHGFDDDFTAASGNHTKLPELKEAMQDSPVSKEGVLAPSRPPFTSTDSNTSQLPTPGAQASPPTYDSTMGTKGPGHRKESNQFPAEYSGLLPSRDDPTSSAVAAPTQSNNVASAAGIDKGLNFFGNDTLEQAAGHTTIGSSFTQEHSPMSPGASNAAPYAYTQSPPPVQQAQSQIHPPTVPPKAPADDFDAEFGDLSEAREAEDEGEADFGASRRSDFDEFNPTFDSPSMSRHTAQSTASTFPPSDSFANFDSSTGNGGTGSSSQQKVPQETLNHDWDAIFAGLDTPQNNGVQSEIGPRDFSSSIQSSTSGPMMASKEAAVTKTAAKPNLNRVMTNDTTQDDPILKDLMGMGFGRMESLQTLEKFDYNLDKVSQIF